MRVTDLRCEYQRNPLGIDVTRPRLSWRLAAAEPGARQTAYQIIVTDAAGKTLWDSGEVASSQSVGVEYGGPAPRSGERLTWKVRVWDQAGAPTRYSPAAWWELGLLAPEDWSARWIGASLVGGARSSIPCPYLRRAFTLGGPVARARLYITALGLYEAHLNGARVGADELAPGWTDYRHRVRYQTYDVTDLLREGDNVLGAILGDGWYCGHLAWRDRQAYGDRPRLLAQLVVELRDGSRCVVASDENWQYAFGPLLEADLLHGEHYDARLELADWASPEGGAVGVWQAVETLAQPDGLALVAQNGPAIRRQEEIAPIAAPRRIETSTPWGAYIYDLGQNMTGIARLRLRGPRGATVRIRYAEVLNPDGTLYTTNLRSARATDYYTLKGAPEGETWEPRFTFHGFRYVELSGPIEPPDRDAVTGVVLHSAFEPTGSFECSEPLLNQLQHNITWGWKGNAVDVPTDCPQRDERLGWTGDAQVFCATSAYNTDALAFWEKWLRDLEDGQSVAGSIPAVAPDTDAITVPDGGPAWSDAAVIVPWTLYVCYGDVRPLERSYGMMTRYVDYLRASSPDLIRCNPTHTQWGGFGDWLALDGSGTNFGGTPKDLIGTALFAYSARLLARIAAILGKDADAARYGALADAVRQAFCNRFVTPDGYLTGGTQTSYVLALHFDLLPEAVRPTAFDWLVRDIRARGNHLSTGFVGTSYLPYVLLRYGRLDVAYDLLMQTTWPCWLYAVTQGATTIWERWDGWTHDRGFQTPEMNSFNHYAYGAIGAWMYQVIAGIAPDPERPGYQHIIMRPQPGAGLTRAHGRLNSPYGLIESDWRITAADGARTFHWRIVVPPNATATVYLPGAAAGEEVPSGAHQFEAAL